MGSQSLVQAPEELEICGKLPLLFSFLLPEFYVSS